MDFFYNLYYGLLIYLITLLINQTTKVSCHVTQIKKNIVNQFLSAGIYFAIHRRKPFSHQLIFAFRS